MNATARKVRDRGLSLVVAVTLLFGAALAIQVSAADARSGYTLNYGYGESQAVCLRGTRQIEVNSWVYMESNVGSAQLVGRHVTLQHRQTGAVYGDQFELWQSEVAGLHYNGGSVGTFGIQTPRGLLGVGTYDLWATYWFYNNGWRSTWEYLGTCTF